MAAHYRQPFVEHIELEPHEADQFRLPASLCETVSVRGGHRSACPTKQALAARRARNLLEGQYENPVRVVAFNAAEGWSRHVTVDIADEFALTLSTPKCRDRFLRSSRPINRAEAVAALWWMVSQLETAPLATPSLVLH
jgi:hypothetical protein